MEIRAEQFVTCRSRRVLTDDGQQGMDGKWVLGLPQRRLKGW